MNFKKILLLATLLVLLTVAASATGDTGCDTDTVSDCVYENTPSTAGNVQSSLEEAGYNTIQKDEKNIKTASKSYEVTDYNTLHQALTNNTYNSVTINIKSNIQLNSNTRINEAITKLTINANDKTINGNNKYQFLEINPENQVTINNAKIINCYAANGGAILNKGSLTIQNSNLNNNNALYEGGAIRNSLAKLTITNSILNNNRANNSGGAIQNYYSNATINNSTLNDNKAKIIGGAIYNLYSNLAINKSTLNNNNAIKEGDGTPNYYTYCGGAIRNFFANLTITNSNLNNNRADYDGGAIYNYEYSKLIIKNTTLNNNYAANTGAAIRNCANLTVINSTLNNNKADYTGAAIYDTGNTTINSSTLNNNTAKTYGGAIYTASNLNMTKCTLNTNTANDGGAIYNWGNLTIKNMTLKDNYASNAGAAIRNCANLTIINSTLNNNRADYGGAAVYNTGKLTINNTNLNNNRANNSGGAIYDSGRTSIYNSNLNNNYAKNAGAAIRSTLSTTINNSTLNNNQADYSGGALYNSANMTINNSTLNNNKASVGGTITNAMGNLTIKDSILSNNTATGTKSYGDGGAIYNTGNTNINNSTINSNTANNYGAAIYNEATTTIKNSKINNNNAKYNGGAIFTKSNLILNNNTFKNNTAKTGAAMDIATGNATIEKNTFIANKANMTGKAIINNTITTITSNTNADTSKYSGTIYTSGKKVTIKNNIFDDATKNTKTTVSTANGIIGEKMTLKATVTDTDNKKVNEGNLIFKLNGITIKDNGKLTGSNNPLKVKVTNGAATATVTPDLSMRNANKLTASYVGTDSYTPSVSNQVKIQVSQRNASIVVSSNKKTIKQGQVLTLKAQVYDTTGGKRSTNLVKHADEFVYFKVNGITLKDAKGNMLKVKLVNGVATTNYTVPLGLSGVTDGKTMTPKNHTILAGFYNKNYQENIKNTSNFQVERSNITITITGATVNNKTHKLSLTATIKDYLGNIVAGPNKCVIKINGVSLKNGTQQSYYYSTDGVLKINNINIPAYNNYKSIEIVTQDRLAYKSQRNTTTTIKVVN